MPPHKLMYRSVIKVNCKAVCYDLPFFMLIDCHWWSADLECEQLPREFKLGGFSSGTTIIQQLLKHIYEGTLIVNLTAWVLALIRPSLVPRLLPVFLRGRGTLKTESGLGTRLEN